MDRDNRKYIAFVHCDIIVLRDFFLFSHPMSFIFKSCFPQNNYLVFMAELFWWFEVVKPSFVKPRLLDTENTGKS